MKKEYNKIIDDEIKGVKTVSKGDIEEIMDKIDHQVRKYFYRLTKLNLRPDLVSIYPTYGAVNAIQIAIETCKLMAKIRENRTRSQVDLAIFSIIPQWYTSVYNRCKIVGAKIIDIPLTFSCERKSCTWNFDSKKFKNILSTIKSSIMPLVYIVNPNNPTGKIIVENEIEEILRILSSKNGAIIIDTTYIGFELGNKKTNLAYVENYIKNETVPIFIAHSLSKFFGAPELRAGFLITNDNIEVIDDNTATYKLEDIIKAVINSSTMGVSIPILLRISELLGAETWIRNFNNEVLKDIKRKVKKLIRDITAVGYRVAYPEASYYVFPRLPDKYPYDSEVFANMLEKKFSIRIIPGTDFGSEKYKRFLSRFFRISLAGITSLDQLDTLISALSSIVD